MIFGMSLTDLVIKMVTLPAHTRAYLAEALLESLDFEEDLPLSAAWRKEVENRCKQLDDGLVVAISAERVFSELRTQFDI